MKKRRREKAREGVKLRQKQGGRTERMGGKHILTLPGPEFIL